MQLMLLRKNNLNIFSKKIPITLICVIIFSCSIFSQNEDKFIKKGKKHVSKKQYSEAIIQYTNALNLNPKNINTLIYRALAYELKKEHKNSVKDITKVLELGYNAPSLYLRRAFNYHDLKQDSLALIDINKYLKKEPNSLTGLFIRGRIKISLKEYPLAIEDFTKMLNNSLKERISSNGLDYIYFSRAESHYKNHAYEKAFIDFDYLIKKDSTDYATYSYLIKTIFWLKDYKNCIAHCDNYIKKNEKKSNIVQRYKAMSLKKLKRYDDALITLDRLLKDHPKDNIAYNSRADLKLITGDFEEAMIDVNKSLLISEKYISALLTKSELLYEMKDYVGVCIYYYKAIDLGFKPSINQLQNIKDKCNN
jgi:tetratricopeptide (TPR) repeat protein